MMPHLDIYCGDAAHKLVNVPAESIELVVTSPPYDDARKGACAGMDWPTFTDIARELHRVLAPGGILCWNVNDMVVNGSETLTSCKQKIFFVEQCGFRCHDTMIYEKSNGSKPDPTRYNPCMEYIFILTKDTVLDPMGGSGTTAMMAMMALQNGRHAILIDRNPDYVALMRESCHITPGLQLA